VHKNELLQAVAGNRMDAMNITEQMIAFTFFISLSPRDFYQIRGEAFFP
jgi:hypothetical protein